MSGTTTTTNHLQRKAQLFEQLAVLFAEMSENFGELADITSAEVSATPALPEKTTSRRVAVADGNVSLDTTNKQGWNLRHCLLTMLRKWDEQDPAWQPGLGLARQASVFSTSVEHLHSLIRADPYLDARFKQYPASGYTG
jgi:hypothetical protein